MDKNKKAGRYKRVYDQLEELLKTSEDLVANQATISAVLHHKFDYFFWTGFYNLKDGELMVGPYQGPVACILLRETGVCWSSIKQQKTLIVPDVHQFPGHIACDARSKSEIVIPVRNTQGEVIGVLDVDSKELDSFDEADAEGLERIVQLLIK